jgi:hypothetical protein
MRFAILGNHAAYHSGSRAVMDYLMSALHGDIVISAPDAYDEVRARSDYDVLIVNGEGSMHHGAPTFRRKMEVIAWAVSLGKQVHLVNSLWQQNPSDFDETLRSLREVTVREVMSARDLAERHGIAANVALDFSYFAPVARSWFARNWSGRLVTSEHRDPMTGRWTMLDQGPLKRAPVASLTRMSWSRLVNSLRGAKLFVTGRHHGVYAACRAEVPFLAYRGNSHKIEGLIASAGVEIPVFDRPDNLSEQIERCLALRPQYDALFHWMASQSRWKYGEPNER